MDAHAATTTPAVEVTRTYRAPQALVFKALTDPSMLVEWFARAPGTPPASIVHADVRPGGVYVIDVVGPEDGLTYRMQGTYREVQPPDRLSFTWWHDRADYGPSIVTIVLRERGDSTELTLTHELLPERMRAPHHQGWIGCLDGLAAVIGAAQAS
jgi:uncharacterized protein YndB with AHSA1/START domain